MRHPLEADLALYAAGDCGRLQRYRLGRHIRECSECTERIAEFESLRLELKDDDLPAGVDWSRLSAEMRANIHVGIEAGECVRTGAAAGWTWNPRLAVAFASLLLLAGAGFVLKSPQQSHAVAHQAVTETAPVLESTGSGLEVRSGNSSFTLLNHHGEVAAQTVSAQGEIRARYISAGTVTINNVYLE